MVLSNFCHQLRIFVQRAGFFAVNGKVHKRSARYCAFAFLPEFFQLLVDPADFDRKPQRICFGYRRHITRLGSTRVSRAADGVVAIADFSLQVASSLRSFRRDAETSTRDACLTRQIVALIISSMPGRRGRANHPLPLVPTIQQDKRTTRAHLSRATPLLWDR